MLDGSMELYSEWYKARASELSDERRKNIEADKERIQQISSGEELVSFIRKKHDLVVTTDICQKVLSMQDEAIPLLLRRYRTTLQSDYMEIAIMIFYRADERFLKDLMEIYHDIRSPYAQALACVVLGFRKYDEAAQLLIDEFERFQREKYTWYYEADDSEVNLETFVLAALHCLYGRI